MTIAINEKSQYQPIFNLTRFYDIWYTGSACLNMITKK
jgi:hypothetical protein